MAETEEYEINYKQPGRFGGVLGDVGEVFGDVGPFLQREKVGNPGQDSDVWLPEFPDLSPRILNPENKWMYNELNNQTGGAFQRAVDRKNERHFAGIRAEQERGQVQKRLKGLQDKEEQLKQVLRGQVEGNVSALDAQLDRLLTEAGINAGQARSQVGAGMADRGLLRSTFASRGIEDVTLKEQEQKGGLRVGTEQSKTQVLETEKKVLRTLSDQRERLSAAKTLAELDQIEKESFLYTQEGIQNELKKRLMDINLSERNSALLWGALGGVLKAGGTVAGFAAVSAAGAAA